MSCVICFPAKSPVPRAVVERHTLGWQEEPTHKSWFCEVPHRIWACLPGSLVDSQCQAHIHCPIRNSGMNTTFTTSNYFLSVDLFIICLPTRWQLHGGGGGERSCLSLSLLYRTPVASSVPGTGKILNTYLANELMNKLIAWSPAKPILLWELWFSHGKWGMDRSRQFLNGKYK